MDRFYPDEAPTVNHKCRYCQLVVRRHKVAVYHIHSCARKHVVTVDTNYYPWPQHCTFMLSKVSTTSTVDGRCRYPLVWDTKKDRENSIAHISSHRKVYGFQCRYGSCGRKDNDDTVVEGPKFPSLGHLNIHIEEVHKFSLRERDALYCFLCECWLPQRPEAEYHIFSHQQEIIRLIELHGFAGAGLPKWQERIVRPWFCPFCYHDATLVPTMKLAQRVKDNAVVHVRGHVNALPDTQTHPCPVSTAKLCDDLSLMTPSQLGLHLKVAHLL